MSTSTINSPSTPPGQARHKLSQPKQEQAQRAEQVEKSAPKLTPGQQQKASLNVSILESAQVSLGAKDQPLVLLLRTAIDKINESLAPELGEDAIQKAVDSGLDTSPEATAERIVSLSTAFFDAYQEQNPTQDDAVALEKFMATIGSGIDKGFEEARNILEGLNVLDGQIASDIDETYSLVQEKLAAFEALLAK
jgi:hypothetical protein